MLRGGGFEIKVGCGAKKKKVSEVTERKKSTFFSGVCLGTFGSPGNARHAALGGALERGQTRVLSLSI